MNRVTPSPEFRRLLDRLIEDGGLSRSEMGRFEELLLDPALREYCCEILQHEALMPEALAALDDAVHAVPIAAGKPSAFRRVLPLAAAAVLMFSLGWIGGQLRPEPAAPTTAGRTNPTPVPAAARITGMIGVEWSDAGRSPGIDPGSVAAERIAFDTGLVELTYASGVRVMIEGPADFSVTGAGSCRMDDGKLVARVPPGAEGFTVDYGNGRVVDLGTEFAMEVRDGGKLELGVFDGEVELHLPGDDDPFYLAGSQAVVHDHTAEEPLVPVPFDREKFVRQLPSRDFPWKIVSAEPVEWSVDVSHLVWKPADYRAIFKWISGRDAVEVSGVELRCDGQPVAVAPGPGRTGPYDFVRGNLLELHVTADAFRDGRWTLHATLTPVPRAPNSVRPNAPVLSSGIVLFEEGSPSQATRDDFVGRWAYHFAGARWTREFHADGTISLSRNGRRDPRAFAGSRWWVEGGVLYAESPKHPGRPESHVLRDRNTLIFTNLAFENARRQLPEPAPIDPS